MDHVDYLRTIKGHLSELVDDLELHRKKYVESSLEFRETTALIYWIDQGIGAIKSELNRKEENHDS